jgi:hypothetical protein
MNADADTLKASATGAMKHLWSGHTKVALWSAPNSRTRNKTASPFFSTRRKSPDTAQNRIRKERFVQPLGGCHEINKYAASTHVGAETVLG